MAIHRAFLAFSLLALVACGTDVGDDVSNGNGADHDDPRDLGGVALGGGGAAAGPTSNGNESAETGDEEPSAAGEAPSISMPGAVMEPGAVELAGLTRSDWMARVPGLGKKPLNQIVIPGTHDSGTYGLISTYDRPVEDVFAPDAEDPIVRTGGFVHLADKWGKAQAKSITDQLNEGMRYIDLRPCKEKNGTIRICHALYGPKLGDLLDEVRAFADAHPKEVVLLSVGGFAGMDDDAGHASAGQLIEQRIGTRLINYAAGDVSPAMTLEDVWTKHPDQSVLVLYPASHARPAFFPKTDDSVFNSYVETWDKNTKKQSILTGFAGAATPAHVGQFFITSAPSTPDEEGKLIASSIDPLGNFPKSLHELADDTNPVFLGWVRDEWQDKRINILPVDFYEESCVYEVALRLNGVKDVSFDSCNIGKQTPWGSYAFGPYGRGAGTPLKCSPDQENINGLCYTRCAPGFASPYLFPMVCAQACPSGYRDDGLTCFRDAEIISANNRSCPWYDKCGLTLSKGCSKCPSGYKNDGCTCRIDARAISKTQYNRGVGRIPASCAAGEERDGLLCYPTCRAGWKGVGPMCWPQ